MSLPTDMQLIETGRHLADRGVFGFVWADERLVARERFGVLVDFVAIGRPITETVSALAGSEDAILALMRRPSGLFPMPNVKLDAAEPASPRLNLVVHWLPSQRRFLLVAVLTVGHHDIEVTVSAAVRGRAIAEAKVTEQKLVIEAKNGELTRVNQDLAEFASVISHDLGSPMRRLRHFVDKASEAIGSGRHAEASVDMAAAHAQALRMSTMLRGLLDYSRIGRKIEAVETAVLVARIVESIERGPGMAIEVAGDWPTVASLAEPLDIVLRNLITNAVKHHDRARGRVIAEGSLTDTAWVVSVIDDGPGIPPEWHAAIFEPFRRIAEDDTHPESSGIGLALVKRTIDTIGGRIEVASEPARSRGSTFRVHWPLSIAA